MPGDEGNAFIRKIRELEDGTADPVPAIAPTAFAQSEDRLRALRSSFQMHIPKPFLPAELLTVIASLVSRVH